MSENLKSENLKNENLKALPDCPYYLPCGYCDILVQRNKNNFVADFQDVVCRLYKPEYISEARQ